MNFGSGKMTGKNVVNNKGKIQHTQGSNITVDNQNVSHKIVQNHSVGGLRVGGHMAISGTGGQTLVGDFSGSSTQFLNMPMNDVEANNLEGSDDHPPQMSPDAIQPWVELEERLLSVESSVNVLEKNVRMVLNKLQVTDELLDQTKNRQAAVRQPDSNVEATKTNARETKEQIVDLQHRIAVFEDKSQTIDLKVKDLATMMDCEWKQEPTFQEALRILPLASRLGMKNLIGELTQLLMDSLNNLNCVVIFRFAQENQLRDLGVASQKIICENFTRVSRIGEGFSGLSMKDLYSFVFHENLNATEELVFDVIVRWILYDLDSRSQHVPELLPAINLSKCGLRFLKYVLQHSLVQNQTDFLKTVQDKIQKLESLSSSSQYLEENTF